MRGAQLALCDITAEGLAVIHQLAELMNRAWDAQLRISSSTERRELLPEADFVLVSIQVGPREDVWEQDWRIPLRHGVRQPYAENGGPGSFAHTARNLPLIMAIARDMEALCPDAWCLNLVNPLIRLTTALHRHSRIQAVGLCHQLLWGYTMAAAVLADRWGIDVPAGFHVHTDADNIPAFLAVAREAVKHLDIKAAGINHFSWVYEIRDRHSGEDLYPELRERWFTRFRRDFEPLSREIFQIYGLMPTAGDSHLCEYLTWVSDPATQPWRKYDLKLQSWDGNRRRRASRWQLARDIIAGRVAVDDLRDLSRHGMLDEGIPEMVAAVHYDRPRRIRSSISPTAATSPICRKAPSSRRPARSALPVSSASACRRCPRPSPKCAAANWRSANCTWMPRSPATASWPAGPAARSDGDGY